MRTKSILLSNLGEIKANIGRNKYHRRRGGNAMVFHEVSRECLEWMEKQPSVKEESLTDWLLYEVSKKNK